MKHRIIQKFCWLVLLLGISSSSYGAGTVIDSAATLTTVGTETAGSTFLNSGTFVTDINPGDLVTLSCTVTYSGDCQIGYHCENNIGRFDSDRDGIPDTDCSGKVPCDHCPYISSIPSGSTTNDLTDADCDGIEDICKPVSACGTVDHIEISDSKCRICQADGTWANIDCPQPATCNDGDTNQMSLGGRILGCLTCVKGAWDPTWHVCTSATATVKACSCKDQVRPKLSPTTDTDKDGIFDACDNCVNTLNPDQKDSDPAGPDGLGDACDAGCSSDAPPSTRDGIPVICKNGDWIPTDPAEVVPYCPAISCTPKETRSCVTSMEEKGCQTCMMIPDSQEVYWDTGCSPQNCPGYVTTDCSTATTNPVYPTSNMQGVTGEPADTMMGTTELVELPCKNGDYRGCLIDATNYGCERCGSISDWGSCASSSVDNCGPTYACKDGTRLRSTGAYSSIDVDTDNDSVPDGCDNCPMMKNADQMDKDGNKIGDACEPPAKTVTDTTCTPTDNCPNVDNPDQADEDKDGVGDACDNCVDSYNSKQEDIDKDGVGDYCDNCLVIPNTDQADADSDRIGDACESDSTCHGCCPTCCCSGPGCPARDCIVDVDKDSDHDGWNNAIPGCDNCPAQFNPDQNNADIDTYGDACDNCVGIGNQAQTDTNQNGVGDACEPIESGSPGETPDPPVCGPGSFFVEMTDKEAASLDLSANDVFRLHEGLPVPDPEGNLLVIDKDGTVRGVCKQTKVGLGLWGSGCDCDMKGNKPVELRPFISLFFLGLLFSSPILFLRRKRLLKKF